jgi:hypothetical protein
LLLQNQIAREATMRAGFVVSLAAALTLMIFVPAAQAVGLGKTCSTFGGPECDAGFFCQHSPGGCHTIVGTCVKVPAVCPRHVVQPVCGCNGQTYNNDCERQKEMISENHPGKCN